MILADTSVWIGHFRTVDPQLEELLLEGRILTHPMVIGEIACGNLSRRAECLYFLQKLPQAIESDHDEVLQMLERHHLWGKGIGWIDLHLLASTLLTGCRLWTLDQRLDRVAERLVNR